MAMAGKGAGFLLVVVFVASLFLQVADAQTLRVGFYNQTCRTVESIVAKEVQRAASTDRTILASLIRLHFHDLLRQRA
jgi:peroxidase